jgi:murein L,D-transpeptidase YafK
MIPLILCLTLMHTPPSFKEKQLQHARVKVAYQEKEAIVKQYFIEKGISFDGFHLFIRAFKKDNILQVWVKEKNATAYTLLHTYAFCASSGTPGPKRREGDLQIPEGVYHINHFNPESNFFLSLGISYPNASDLVLSDKRAPGSAIYIHGNCVTIGCIPITDDKIKELYVLAVEARNNGQQEIPVHIFPSRLDDSNFNNLLTAYGSQHKAFWENLRPIYTAFEKTYRVSSVSVDSEGRYHLK